MEQIILSLISQLNSSIFVMLGLLLLAFWATYKIGMCSQKFIFQDDRLKNVEGLSEKVIELKTKIDLIYQYVNPNSPLKSYSPLSLTPIGEEIVNNIKAKDIFERYVVKLIKEVELKNPKNAYDIQQLSIEVAKNKLEQLLDEKELIMIKQEAYSKGILVSDILSVFGVLLRNYILDSKKISISEVDKHSER